MVGSQSVLISERAIILRWMMARSEAWLRVTSSAAVGSYNYSYDPGSYNKGLALGKSHQVGNSNQHSA
jgi:hypothetical protein